MTEFDRKVEEASARINRSVANISETLEKETSELVTYLNDEVVPAVRTHSSKALRTAAGKLAEVRGLSGNTAQEFLIRLPSSCPPKERAGGRNGRRPARSLSSIIPSIAGQRASERLRSQPTQAQVPPPPSFRKKNHPRLHRLRKRRAGTRRSRFPPARNRSSKKPGRRAGTALPITTGADRTARFTTCTR
jgi:hypothetical protein